MNKEDKEQSIGEEIRASLAKGFTDFMNWLSFNDDESWYINTLRLLYKIPVALFMLFLSPILLLILGFTFVAVL